MAVDFLTSKGSFDRKLLYASSLRLLNGAEDLILHYQAGSGNKRVSGQEIYRRKENVNIYSRFTNKIV